jgi:hypothetical protein
MLSVGTLTVGMALPRARKGGIASVARADGGGKSYAVEHHARLDRLQDAIATQPGRTASA